MKLETENIFLDTSIFEKNNFLNSRNINSLIKHAEEGTIKLFSCQIAITELKERVKKRVKAAKTELKKLRSQKNIEVFRNTDTYELFEKIWKIDFLKEIKTIENKIDEIIKETPIQLISTTEVNVDLVFDKYFNNKAPFKEGEKKFEFPDAFILSSIDLWCKRNNDKMIIISSDNDWLNYETDYIEKIGDFDELLNMIAIHKEITWQEKRVEFIDKIFKDNHTKLEEKLKEYFLNDAYFDTEEAELEDLGILEMTWDEYLITELDEEYAELNTLINLKIDAAVSYEDYENGYYDKEDDQWYFVETVNEKVERELSIPITIGISYNLDSADYEIFIENVNSGKTIDMNYSSMGNPDIYE